MAYVETSNQPICPREPDHPAHQAVTRTLNSFYENIPKDEDGEMEEPAATAYHEAAYGKDRMSLHVHQTGIRQGPHGLNPLHTTVTAAWWRCNVCGFVLPAEVSTSK